MEGLWEFFLIWGRFFIKINIFMRVIDSVYGGETRMFVRTELLCIKGIRRLVSLGRK